LQGKQKLQAFVRKEQADGIRLETLVCEGVPFMEINKKANEVHAEMIVIGSCGNAGDMNTIFFGITSEKIPRFITRPVLCVPPETEQRDVG
jgi:nucleotide-binding universal stress UspA family protein